jgi:hypothetical protein
MVVRFASNATNLEIKANRRSIGSGLLNLTATQDDIMPYNGRFGLDFYAEDENNGDACTELVFGQQIALEDAIGSHASSLKTNLRATNDIPLEVYVLLPLPSYLMLKGVGLTQAVVVYGARVFRQK